MARVLEVTVGIRPDSEGHMRLTTVKGQIVRANREALIPAEGCFSRRVPVGSISETLADLGREIESALAAK